jgi:hypothetical protein
MKDYVWAVITKGNTYGILVKVHTYKSSGIN